MTSTRGKFKGKLFICFLVVIAGSFAVINAVNYTELKELNQAKLEIQLEIDEYNLKKAELELSRSYYDSDAYVEKVAREQLGLVKPDEVLYYNDAK